MSDLKGKCVGFDIGSLNLHFAVREGGRVTRVGLEPLPEGLVQGGQILSFEALADFLKALRRQYRLPRKAALVLPPAVCYCRRLTTAAMSEDQLKFNLPYEFHEYITGAKEDYFYDYALVGGAAGPNNSNPEGLDLMAAAVPKRLIADYATAFKHAGFSLKAVMPDELAYINLARTGGDTAHSHCILDLGHSAVRLYMFTGDTFENLRTVDYGLAAVDRVIAETCGVDIHIAATYRETNHDDCLALPECAAVYNAIAVEVLKAVNFQRFSSGGMEPAHIHCCGGGISNPEMIETLRATVNLPLEDMQEFWPDLNADLAADAALAAAAAGAVNQ